MKAQKPLPSLTDIAEAIDRIRAEVEGISVEAFAADWRKCWLVERGVEIISEASRRLPDELKQRHPGIPWQKVAGIGNVLRHDYESIAPALMWKLVREDLSALDEACRFELGEASKRTDDGA